LKGEGFSKLTEEEYRLLSAFPIDKEIAFPVDCGFSRDETIRLLESLKRKDAIVGRAPYRLTKKGLKELQLWKKKCGS
jgi:dihydropteroate synthase